MGGPPLGNWYNTWLYGSNSLTDFNDVSDITMSGNVVLLYTFTYSSGWSPSMGYILLTAEGYIQMFRIRMFRTKMFRIRIRMFPHRIRMHVTG